MYRDAQAAIRKREPPFKVLTETIDPALIKEWSAMATKWEIKKGKYSSPYDAHIENGACAPYSMGEIRCSHATQGRRPIAAPTKSCCLRN